MRAMLETYVDRIPLTSPDNWTVHPAGHPPLALLFFVGLVKVGLGGSLAAGTTVTVLAATTAPAVLRRGAPARRGGRRSPRRAVRGALPRGGLRGGLGGRSLRGTRGVGAGRARCRRHDPAGRTRDRLGRAGGLAARLLRDGVLRPAAVGLPRSRGALAGQVVAPAPGRRAVGAGLGARLRGPRLRVVGGLPGAARPLLGGPGEAAACGVLALGQPRRPAPLRRARCWAPGSAGWSSCGGAPTAWSLRSSSLLPRPW